MMTAEDVSNICKEVEFEEKKVETKEFVNTLGQYSGATLDGGEERLSKFARLRHL